mmetsp:Transcript_74864/g.165320  ORF Transcript_74864/g.165320 Transcript_74864/m.165320 type:complete len:92 (-) Transcript_74864:919-1194(-)
MRRKLDKDMTGFCEADLILDGTLNRNFHHCTSYQASAYIFQSQRKMCKIPYAKIQCRSSREVLRKFSTREYWTSACCGEIYTEKFGTVIVG